MNLFESLKCEKEMTDVEKINFMGGISENNVMDVLAQIEKKLKYNEKISFHFRISHRRSPRQNM